MKPEELKLLNEVNERLKKVEQYTTSLGGSLEFKTLVQRYAKDKADVTDITISGTITHSGSSAGFFGVTPVGQQANISAPSGGLNIDTEARTTIGLILTALDNLGLTA